MLGKGKETKDTKKHKLETLYKQQSRPSRSRTASAAYAGIVNSQACLVREQVELENKIPGAPSLHQCQKGST